MNLPLKVLIIDDNEKMRSMIRSIVKRKANEVFECSDGMEVLGEYGIHRPDWVVMDVKMKKMDGFTATELLHQYFPKAKVMIVSQYDEPGMREQAQKVGAAAFVAKDDLLDILDHLKK